MNGYLKFFVFVTLFTLFFSTVIFAESIKISAHKSYFPATYFSEKGWEGMDIDIIRELCYRAGLDYEIIDYPFKRSLIDLKGGQIDLIPNLVKNNERSAYMNWLGPVRITGIGLVVLKDNQHLPIPSCNALISIANQKRARYGYIRGASYSKYFDIRIKNDPTLKNVLFLTTGFKQNLKMLINNRIIGFFHDAFEIRQQILTGNNILDGLALHPYRIEGSFSGAYIGLSKKLPKSVYQALMKSFQSIKQDGTLAKIHEKWVGEQDDL